jgi:hypothetical protein
MRSRGHLTNVKFNLFRDARLHEAARMIQKTWKRFKSRPLRKNLNNRGHYKRPEAVHVQNSSSRQAYFSQDQSYSNGGQASSSSDQPCANGGQRLSSEGSCSSGDDFSKLEPPLRSPVLQSEQNMRKSYGTGLEFVQTYSEEAVHAQMISCDNAAHAQESWAQKAVQEHNISSENATHAQINCSQKAVHALKIGGENAAHAQNSWSQRTAHTLKISGENSAPAQDSWSQKAAHALKISSENAVHAQNICSKKAALALKISGENAAHALKIGGENAAHAQEMRNVKAAHAQEEEEGADLSLVLRTLAQHGLSEVRTVSLYTVLPRFIFSRLFLKLSVNFILLINRS